MTDIDNVDIYMRFRTMRDMYIHQSITDVWVSVGNDCRIYRGTNGLYYIYKKVGEHWLSYGELKIHGAGLWWTK